MYELLRPLGGGLRQVVSTEEKDVEGTVLDPKFAEEGVAVIRLPLSVVSVRGRVELWSAVSEPRFDPTKVETEHKVTEVKVPYLKSFGLLSTHNVLPTILHKANALLRTAEAYRSGEAKAVHVQTSVNRYMDSLVEELSSKYGMLSRHIYGVRTPNSMRAVVVPDPELAHDEVGIPVDAVYKAGINAGDLVVVTRSPILWEGSVLVLRATIGSRYTCRLNPFVLDLMGADFDGDTVAVVKVPEDPAVQHEASTLMDETTRKYARWSAEFLMWDATEEIDWSDPQKDVDARLQLHTGDGYMYPLGPKDLVDPDNSETITNMEHTGSKKRPADMADYVQGLSEERFATVAKDVVAMTIRMKVELGLVGSVTEATVLSMYLVDRPLVRTALLLKEKITQALLDSKHGMGAFDTFEIVDILARRSAWHPNHARSHTEAVEALASQGLPKDIVEPIIVALWPYAGVYSLLQEMSPGYQATRRVSKGRLLELIDRKDDSFTGRLAAITGFVESV